MLYDHTYMLYDDTDMLYDITYMLYDHTYMLYDHTDMRRHCLCRCCSPLLSSSPRWAQSPPPPAWRRGCCCDWCCLSTRRLPPTTRFGFLFWFGFWFWFCLHYYSSYPFALYISLFLQCLLCNTFGSISNHCVRISRACQYFTYTYHTLLLSFPFHTKSLYSIPT